MFERKLITFLGQNCHFNDLGAKTLVLNLFRRNNTCRLHPLVFLIFNWIKAFFKFEYPARVFIGDELRCRDNRRQIDVSLNLPDLLAHLPRGLDTRLGRSFDDGAVLSFGQWQRLALRRALVKDAALLILDEPSSFLDTATAAALRTIVADRQDQALLVATHDPAVASIADRVVRLEGGRVVV